MKKVLSIVFILGLLFCLNFVLAEFFLPSPPPAPGVDSSQDSSSNVVPNTYVSTQEDNPVNGQNSSVLGVSDLGKLSWKSFSFFIFLLIVISILIIYFIRKHRHVESI